MVPLLSLWLPILVSAVIVFVVSSIIHMFLKYHDSDFAKLPDEDAFRSAVRPLNLPPGQYVVPHETDQKKRQSDEFKEKCEGGPVAFVTVLPNEIPKMGRALVQWFVYAVVVGIFAAYIAGRAVPPGGDYLEVFRFAGCTAFVGYSLALLQGSIWFSRSWSVTLKSVVDGLIYGLLTGGTFGWLWP
jgi:hypothetical protein